MSNQVLHLQSKYAKTFAEYQKSPIAADNLFVITHLGQLKQMEALIAKKQLTNNGLVVLYTVMNFIVPQTVHDKVNQSLFDWVVFVEIPIKINQVNYFKLKTIHQIYQSLINSSKPQSLYLNSFEGHYAILIDIAKKHNVKNILVEEGTATYKLVSCQNAVANNDSDDLLNYRFVKDKFMQTVGQTEIFKRLVKQRKYTKDLVVKSKQFCKDVVSDERVQGKIIELFGKGSIKAYKEPFLQFDEVYASFPELIEQGFVVKDVHGFNIYDTIDDETLNLAKEVALSYNITSKDMLYLSQRYAIDPIQYVNALTPILLNIAKTDSKIFIKLHPKESQKTFNAFREIVKVFPDKLVLIEDNRFLVEPVIKISGVQKVIGLTSTTLVYAPLISENTQSISVARALMNHLPKTDQNAIGCRTIQDHLDILKIFPNIQFYGDD